MRVGCFRHWLCSLLLIVGLLSSLTPAMGAVDVQVESRRSSWVRLGYDGAAGLNQAASIDDVAWLGAGPAHRIPWTGDRFVAAGALRDLTTQTELRPLVAALWLSRDGRRWNEVSNDALPAGAVSLGAPTQYRNRLYLFGRDQAGSLVAWHASQRSEWTATLLSGSTTTPGYVNGALAYGDDLIAYGAAGNDDYRVWRTRDGEAWESASLPGLPVSMASEANQRNLVALVQQPPATARRVDVLIATDGRTWRRTASLGLSVDPGGETLGI